MADSPSVFWRIPEMLYCLSDFLTHDDLSALSRCSRSLKEVLDGKVYAHINISVRRYLDLPVRARTTLGQTLYKRATHVRRISFRSSLTLSNYEGFEELQSGLMDMLARALPSLPNLERVEFFSVAQVPAAVMLALGTLPKMRELRCAARSFNRQNACIFGQDQGSMYTLHVQRVSGWRLIGEIVNAMSLCELSLHFDRNVHVGARWFTRLRLIKLRLRGGVMQEEYQGSAQILHALRSLEVVDVKNLGWLNDVALANVEQVSFCHVIEAASVAQFLAAGSRRRIRSLKIVLINAVYFPQSLVQAIRWHGSTIEKLWLDNDLTAPGGKYSGHMAHLALNQWRAIAESLTSIRSLTLRPADNEMAALLRSTTHMKLCDLGYPFLPSLETLQPLGELSVEHIIGLLYSTNTQYLYDTRKSWDLVTKPRLQHIILDEDVYGIRYRAGLDTRGCRVLNRISLHLEGSSYIEQLY